MGGSCCFCKRPGISNDNVIKVTPRMPEQKETVVVNKNNIPQTNNNVNEEKFKDMEEYGKYIITKENRFSGEGVKKIKSYKCNLPIDELQQIRIQFWTSKKENHRIWQILKGCCETDASTAQQILSNAKLFPIEGTLKMVADVDGNIYNIPNFCINDPLFVKEYKVDEEQSEKLVELRIIDVFKNNHYKLTISNFKTGKDLKILFGREINLDTTKTKLRFIHNGHEINDDHFLYFFNFDGEHNKIQAMVSPIFKDEENEIKQTSEKNEEKANK